jgi:hypothetical protein
MNWKMADHHLARQACIYIRQSTPGQVRFNQESKERQYNLANQAKALGWMPEQIRILDGDLGHSGEQATHRDDFKTLDDRFHEGCQKEGIHLRFEAPIYGPAGLGQGVEHHGRVAEGDRVVARR